MVRNEEIFFEFYDQMYGVPEGESGTSSSFGFFVAY